MNRYWLTGATLLSIALTALPARAQEPTSPAPGTEVASAAVAASAPETPPRYSPEYYRYYRLRLEYHPIAPVIGDDRFMLTRVMPMYPAGFRADDFGFLLSPVYGFGDGWQVAAALTSAERRGPGDVSLFGGLGVQKQFVHESRTLPAVAVGVYGMAGPDDHLSGTGYLVASKRIFGGVDRGFGVFLHGGLKYETFDNDDFGSGDGVRPFIGGNVTLGSRFYISGDYSPGQAWQPDDMWSVRGTYLVWRRRVGVTGGIRSNGFDTQPFVGITF